MKTAEIKLHESEYRRAINSVLLLREAHTSNDPIMQKRLFEQACDQEASHIAEVLPGSLHTEYKFDTREDRLYVLQPEGVTDWLAMHENGSERAKRMAELNPALRSYAQIAEAELEEAKEQEAMVKTGQPQTLIVLSLCGDDLMSKEALMSIGRDPDKKRAYLRTAIFDGANLHLDSRTIDYMGVTDARDIFQRHFNIDLPKNATSLDILKSRIKLPGARFDTPNTISPKPRENSYEFVMDQPDLLKAHMESLGQLAISASVLELDKYADDLRYDIMSSFKQRLEGVWIDQGSLAKSVVYAGAIERSAGTRFDGCDVVINNQNQDLTNTGYVNAASRELWVWRDGTCRIQNCPSRDSDKKKARIGPCDVCEKCQSLFDAGMELSDIEAAYKRRPNPKKPQLKTPDFVEVISAELARYKKERQQKRAKCP